MPVKIMIDNNAVAAKVETAWQKGLRALGEQVLNDCNKYCKEDNHILIDSSGEHSHPERGELVWQTSYAKRQYWEIKTSLTPGRTWKWCETAKKKHLEEWQRMAQKGMSENL